MCGITGIVNKKGVDEETLLKMRDTMRHRGPDDRGVWLSPDRKVGLAHRRLSIIDLSEAGRQPMSDAEGLVWLTYNGEIYNFNDIREELIRKGYSFVSYTDSEVIINSYKEWGRECLNKFNGMFAFCLYDDRKKILFLARDRLGKKPLYYTDEGPGSKFVFGSEIKSILKDRSVSRQLDIRSLNFYFTFGYTPGGVSIFSSIKKLKPAHAMVYDINKETRHIWRYWDLPARDESVMDEDELVNELDRLLLDAVKMRMISDVPLGAFLSGGIDSSLVVAMMTRASAGPVKTFSIGFENNKLSELPYARIVSEHFGTDHHEIIVKPDAFKILPDLVKQFDEPFADSSMLPTYYVSRAAREHVTVALSGDGGDELFGGYKLYLYAKYYPIIRKMLPEIVRRGISGAASFLPDGAVGKRQLMRLRSGLLRSVTELSGYMFFMDGARNDLMSPDISKELGADFLYPEMTRREDLFLRDDDFINRITYSDIMTYLPDDILVKVDRMSMLVSLEVRAPLLDYRIAEFAFRNVSGNMKVKGCNLKYLLKRLAARILPKELDINRKQGFSIPVSDWFRGPLSGKVREIILDSESEYLNNDYIEGILDAHMKGVDNSSRLYSLLVFALWRDEYLGNA